MIQLFFTIQFDFDYILLTMSFVDEYACTIFASKCAFSLKILLNILTKMAGKLYAKYVFWTYT